MSAPHKRPIREDSTSYEVTGIPCGDPRRFSSRGAIRMAPSTRPYKSQRLDVPAEEIETEAERQLQQLAKKQMQTAISLDDLRKEKRSFSTGHVQKPLDVSGALSLSSYQTVTGTHESKDALRHMGLSEEQIAIKLMADNEEKPQDTQEDQGYGINPAVRSAQLQVIEEQISAHKKALSKPDTFSHAHYMSRQARDLEAAITQGDEKARLLSRLITDQKSTGDFDDPNHPINKLGDIWSNMKADWKKNRKKTADKHPKEYGDEIVEAVEGEIATCATREEAQLLQKDTDDVVINHSENECEPSEIVSIQNTESHSEFSEGTSHDEDGTSTEPQDLDSCGRGPWKPCEPPIVKQWPPPRTKDLQQLITLASVSDPEAEKRRNQRQARYLVKPVSKEEIVAGRLSCEQLIERLPWYKDLTPGEPSETLYVQNLPSCSEEELFALFLHFQKPDCSDIIIRKMTGRMKGQAFITLDSPETAREALQLLNGYVFKEKPMLIKYGRKKT